MSHNITDNTQVARQFLSAEELAIVVGISPRQIRQLAREGLIPRVELTARTHRYPVAEVREALLQLAQRD